ncbi:Bidirectional sugar transporter SWEET4 [Platanthera zijinensis]|uniref:Bidirectional sugar transporter SWEET4 n=1 Tax=Platanthera zijinensis TaxID=2320716 RepID=A0AAP0BY82_9ASPA
MVSVDAMRTAVGIVGNAIALGLFLSPLIWKNKSVEEFSVIPYVATLLNCMLWMLYGLPIVHPNSTLVLTINAAGTAIELCYVILYLFFSDGPKRSKALLLFIGDLTIVATVSAIVLIFFHTHERRSLIVGILCVIFCIIMYLAPLTVMRSVIKTKSVEYMPLSLSVASFFNGLCWTIYALICFDLYITGKRSNFSERLEASYFLKKTYTRFIVGGVVQGRFSLGGGEISGAAMRAVGVTQSGGSRLERSSRGGARGCPVEEVVGGSQRWRERAAVPETVGLHACGECASVHYVGSTGVWHLCTAQEVCTRGSKLRTGLRIRERTNMECVCAGARIRT